MSAIAGLYHLDHKPVDRTHLVAMRDRLAHRGKDATGVWHQAHIGLVSRLLWSTPESLLENLPAQSRNSVITADARIDNREALIEQLGLKSTTIPDSTLILEAYQKWGNACATQLMGDFAFAIWDQQQQTLFCARDPMGVKPFYYFASRQLFAFATEVKALFCLPEIPQQINELQIALYLMRDFNDREITFYQNIRRLPAAHTLTVSAGQFKLEQYWMLDPNRELYLGSDQAYEEAYQELFTEAVRCRLRSAGAIGSMLSGGLDSSSIACVARNLLNGQSLHTFSAIFPNVDEAHRGWIDERFYIGKVLEQGGFTSQFVECDRLNPIGDYARLFEQIDECFCAPNLYLNWAWFARVQSENVRVVLDGIDGDTTISHGQAYLSDLVRSLQWGRFLHEAKAYANRMGLSKKQVLWEWGILSLIPGNVWQWWEQLQEAQHPQWRRAGIRPEVAARLNLSQHCRNAMRDRAQVPMHTARQVHWHSLNAGLIQYGLELVDKTAAAFSIEPRYPFCDRRLIEFCLAIPAEQKFSQGWTRWIARRAMQQVLPPELQSRLSKANLGISFKANVLKYERDRITSIIERSEILSHYLDPAILKRICQTYFEQPQQEQAAMIIYTALSLDQWMNFLDGKNCIN